ncbi:MAG: ATP-binding protein [Anaerolineae bacterium]|nr:ATP-binding protein [Anaerolineae bacterium]
MSQATEPRTVQTVLSATPVSAAGVDAGGTLAAAFGASVPFARLALLHRAALAFNSTLDLDAVLHSVLEELAVALQADGWVVWLVDQSSGEIECVQSEGPFRPNLIGQRAGPNDGAVSWVIRHGHSINLVHPDDDPRYNEAVSRRAGTPLGSLLCAPLKARGTAALSDRGAPPSPAFGAISVISQKPATFSDEDLTVLEALAAAASGAIANAQLYTQVSLEVDDRSRAERALRHSENQYRTMAETSPDAIVVTDLDGTITYCNTRALELHGFEQRSELLGKSVLMLFAPQCRAGVRDLHRSILEGNTTREHELTLLSKDETTRTVMYMASLVAGEDGTASSIIGFSHDISDMRVAEETIRRHNQELRALNRVATQISQLRDLDSLLDTILSMTLEVLEVDSGCAGLYDEAFVPSSTLLHSHTVSRSSVVPGLSESATAALLEWLGTRLREARRPVSVSTQELPFAWAAAAAEFQIVAVPLTVQERLAGVLAIAGLRNGVTLPLRPQQRQLLSAIGHQVSVAVENARLTAKVAEIDTLRDLSRIRSELLAAFSHDLRTPLGVIQMACSTLQRVDIALDDDMMADCLDDIQTQTERLSRLVDGILDLGHLESGHIQLELGDLEISEVLQQLASETERANPASSVKVALDPGPLTVLADPGRVDQVIRNLLDNAVKFSPLGGDINVSASRFGQYVRISIADQGVGIPTDQRELVFERFYRIQSAETQGIPGTGLGLPTCRSIVEAHGGRIWVESPAPGQKVSGATLTFTLPISPIVESA